MMKFPGKNGLHRTYQKIRIDISKHPHAFVTTKLVGHRKKPNATSMSIERPISYHDVMSSITEIRCMKKKYKSLTCGGHQSLPGHSTISLLKPYLEKHS
jgi:hypothetical protein